MAPVVVGLLEVLYEGEPDWAFRNAEDNSRLEVMGDRATGVRVLFHASLLNHFCRIPRRREVRAK